MGQSHAVAYLRGKLQARNIAVSFELSDQAQEQVHRICGGNAGLIGTLVDSIAICGEVDTGRAYAPEVFDALTAVNVQSYAGVCQMHCL